ncbi:MAG: hypothetical protein KIS62_11790 [Ramlibacter sp.]|nr:hypothetical protein [Ramlibacter sp.]MBX3659121.1 hypothetical protein [Ramlibacter sp.]MCW5650421.1 hypothetical protein [Ramlibacter sp.]
MKVHQLSVTYLGEQDRVLVRINTTDAEELRLWFTRRLTIGLWPVLNKVSTEQLVKLEASVTSGTAPADDDMKKMLADFRKQEFLQQADFDTPYNEQQHTLPLGEEPLLVTDVSITPLPGSMVRMDFVEKPPGDGSPRSFQLELDPQLMQGLLHLTRQALAQADWQVPLTAADLAAVQSDANNDAGEDTAPQRPRYLN